MASKSFLNGYLPHNSVRLVKGGREYFELLNRMISEAKYSIHLQVYIFDEDETGKRVAQSLIDAAKKNVQVHVLIDSYASQNITDEFIGQLLKAGIRFRKFEPLLKSKHFYFGRRLHHKVIVVDGLYGMVGGMNISNRYNDMPEKTAWLDWAIYGEGDMAAVLERICIRRMGHRKVKMATRPPKDLHAKVQEENCDVRVRENDWVRRKREIYKSYLQMFRHSTSHIIIMSPYFLPGNEFRRNMRLAKKRGVKIQLILAGISDIYLSKHAERFVYRWLLKNRIEIYEYQKTVLHGKMAVCDDEWITAGSFNVNDLSAHASVELNVDVKNAHFAKLVAGRLTEIIKTDCVCITPSVYKQNTNVFNRVVQRLAYDFFRLVLFLFTFYFRQRE